MLLAGVSAAAAVAGQTPVHALSVGVGASRERSGTDIRGVPGVTKGKNGAKWPRRMAHPSDADRAQARREIDPGILDGHVSGAGCSTLEFGSRARSRLG